MECAAIVQNVILYCKDPTRLISSQGDCMHLISAMRSGGEVLVPVLNPLHRSAQPSRRPGNQELLRVGHALRTKSSTHIWGLHTKICFIQLKCRCKKITELMRSLYRGPYLQGPVT